MTQASFTAKDHSTVSPYVMAKEANRLIAFLERIFGAEVLMKIAREDGSVMHASVRIGDSVVMIADATADFPAFPAWLHVYVADIDATYAKALAEGAASAQEPSEKGDGDRRGGFTDPSGNTWWIATHIGH